MKQTKLVNGKRVEMTAQQAAEFEAARAPSVAEVKMAKMHALAMEYQQRYFTDAQFYDIEGAIHVVQFRNPKDQANIETVSQAADQKARANPAAVVRFRVADNSRPQFEASRFAEQSVALFDEKQAILHKYWDKLDALGAIEPTEENRAALEGYDPAQGW